MQAVLNILGCRRVCVEIHLHIFDDSYSVFAPGATVEAEQVHNQTCKTISVCLLLLVGITLSLQFLETEN